MKVLLYTVCGTLFRVAELGQRSRQGSFCRHLMYVGHTTRADRGMGTLNFLCAWPYTVAAKPLKGGWPGARSLLSAWHRVWLRSVSLVSLVCGMPPSHGTWFPSFLIVVVVVVVDVVVVVVVVPLPSRTRISRRRWTS